MSRHSGTPSSAHDGLVGSGAGRAERESRRGRRGYAVSLAMLAASSACVDAAQEQTPERVAQQFVDRMQQVHGDVDKAHAAYELLATEARRNLQERAKRASAAAGRIVRPEEMLAPSRFHLSFQPRAWTSRQGKNWAIVSAEGKGPRERREVRLLKEGEHWRVVLDLPELPPVQHRERGSLSGTGLDR